MNIPEILNWFRFCAIKTTVYYFFSSVNFKISSPAYRSEII